MKKSIKVMLTAVALTLSMTALTACGTKDKAKDNEGSSSEVKTISTEDLAKSIKDDKWIVVDTRANDAYNGWKLEGVERGGHIEGAVDFSADWINVDTKNQEESLAKDLESRGISADKNVVLYDANGEDAKEVADYLSKKGFKNLYKYDVKEWAKDESKPMVAYPNYEMLVPASWVKNLVDGKKPETYEGKEFKVFEVSWGEEKDSPDYLKGHIPGAIHINTDELEEGPLWNRLSDDKLIEFAKANGVTTDTTVVLYGGDTCAASRAAVIFKYLGVKDVRLLNGGTSKWVDAGYEVETKSNPKVAVESFGADAPLNRDYIVDYDKALTAVDKPEENTLVDIRSWEEYIGKTSGYSYIKATGRPVCSLWGHGGSDSASMEDFRNEDNTMVSGDQILKMWKEYGITPDKNLMFFCGTGWRAAEVLWYADVMGLENISLYDGGWNEWSGNTGNEAGPVITGEPQK